MKTKLQLVRKYKKRIKELTEENKYSIFSTAWTYRQGEIDVLTGVINDINQLPTLNQKTK